MTKPAGGRAKSQPEEQQQVCERKIETACILSTQQRASDGKEPNDPRSDDGSVSDLVTMYLALRLARAAFATGVER